MNHIILKTENLTYSYGDGHQALKGISVEIKEGERVCVVGSNGAGVKKVYGYFKQQGTKDLSMKLYAQGRHEMLNEINKEEVYKDILEWVNSKL